jgi:pimeloyl-ACP methyl ester carboxylesterase
VNLVYLDLAGGGEGPPAVILHREATTGTESSVAGLRRAGVGRVVAPYGGYAYYPSGMEVGGVCWYRVLPGFSGTDPISLATAVVQVGDVLDDLDLDRTLVVGFGQGAVVALGAGLLRRDRVGWVVGVDPWPGHLALLPPACGMPERSGAGGQGGTAGPPVLLAGSAPGAAGTVEECAAALAGRGVGAATWYPSDEPADPVERDAIALTDALDHWWGSVGGPAGGVTASGPSAGAG